MMNSISSKLLVMTGGVVTAILLVGGLGFYAQREAERDLRLLSNALLNEPLAGLSDSLVAEHLWTQSGVTDLLGGTPQEVDGHLRRYDDAKARVDAAIARFDQAAREPAVDSAWRAFEDHEERLREQDARTWDAVRAGDATAARDRIIEARPMYLEAIAAAEEVADLQNATLSAHADESEAGRQRNSLAQLGVTGLALLVAGVLAWQVRQAVLGPLEALKTTGEALKRGDYSADSGSTSEDEFGPLREALRAAADTLRQTSQNAERIAAGDLAAEVAAAGPGDRIGLAIERLQLTLLDAARQADVIASGNYSADIAPRGPRDVLGIALQKMSAALRQAAEANRDNDWLKSGVAAMNDLVLGQIDAQVLADTAITSVARHLGAPIGALYLRQIDADGPALHLFGSFAFTHRKSLATRYRPGEGLVGQAALERKPIVLVDVPADYIRIASGLGEAAPRNVAVLPVLFKGEVRAVLEVGTLTALTEVERAYLEQAAAVLGAALEIAANRAMVQRQQDELRASNDELQEQTRALEHASQELRAQQTELEQSNAELERQMSRTQESEARLKVQQRELASTNEELEVRNQELERQKAQIERARQELSAQAEELAVASKYKSEFLANMSHELRTPLNSLLLLARSLRDNPEGNLTPDQKESAAVIYSGGNDLLNLINEILDLSKIEAGRMDLRPEPVPLADLAANMERQFDHMARSQGLEFRVDISPELPTDIHTDPQRLGQVLKNLVGNALKFTEAGSVTLAFAPLAPDDRPTRPGLDPARCLAIRVIDTGIGIPADKQRIVFEAFQQADSGDRRKYGGTGLGLSISRELAALLGGEITLRSQVGAGSTFTLLLPLTVPGNDTPRAATPMPPAPVARGHAPATLPPQTSVPDDRDTLREHDRSILIIEDDATFLQVLLGEVRKRGFKGLAALNGKTGLDLARAWHPSGILLDLHLPDTSGWAVLSALKQDVETRHIPVHIVSAEDASLEGLRIGAIGHAHKPLRPEDIDAILGTIEKASATAEKLVLVVEDDPAMRKETVRIVGNGTVHTIEVATGADALQALGNHHFDLMVLDLGLPDMQGLELLERASARRLQLPPIIVYTVRELSVEEELSLRHYADSIIIKDVRSQERLIDEVALFLHRVVNDLPEEKRLAIRHLYESDENLRGRKVLIVEDDMRTMFAMARLLASHGLEPLKAANGEVALGILAEVPDIDLVLLDMMMPVLDGYETARAIRRQERFRNLPVIALTAKAMKEDRQKCIEAGASDYLPKPVDQDRLVSLLRVWMGR